MNISRKIAAIVTAMCTLSFFSVAQAASCSLAPLTNSFAQAINVNSPNQVLFTEAVLYYVNVERCRKGISPVSGDPRLIEAAAGHSVGMARTGIFSHRIPRPGYTTMRQRFDRASVQRSVGGAENITKNYVYAINGRPISVRSGGACRFFYSDSGGAVPKHNYASLAREAVAQWMASSGHRKNILNGRYNRMGAGFGVDSKTATCGDIYLTQSFAG